MASIVPRNIPIQASSSIASYSWTDVASGLGYVIFYPCLTGTAGAQAYAMITNTIPSNSLTAVWSVGVTHNFDTTAFNSPRNIRKDSKAYISYTGDLTAGAGNHYLTFTLKQVSQGVETTIASTVNSTYITSAGTTGLSVLSINKEAHFKKGDILRLTIATGIAGAEAITLGLDPANRTVATFPDNRSVCELYVPFVINL